MPLMWNKVTEIKWNIFGRVRLLKNLFFSNVYISVNTILECCYLFFFGWEIGHPLSTYATGMEGKNPKCVQVRTGRGELKNRSLDTFLLNGWPQAKFVEYLLWNGSVKYTRASPTARKMSLFSSINYDYFILYDNYNLVSSFYIRISTQKRHSIFLKEILTQMFL